MLKRQGRNFHFRRIVPAPLRPLVGQREFWASLGTSSATVARARAGRLYARTEEILSLANRIAKSRMAPTHPDPDAEAQRLMEAAVEDLKTTLELERRAAKMREDILEMRLLAEEADHLRGLTRNIGSAHANLDKVLPRIHELVGEVKAARRGGQEARHLVTELTKLIENLPRPAIGPEARSTEEPRAALSTLVGPFFERRLGTDGTTHQVVGQERSTVRRFIEACGDRPAADYGRVDISNFLGLLRRLPATYGKSPRDKEITLEVLIARADATQAERLTDKTVKRHLSTLSQVFKFAVDMGHLTVAARAELVEDHRFRTDRSARDQRDAWEMDELETLFSSPVWTGSQAIFRSKPGAEILRDAKFWLPLLALFHGARLEEFADLYRRDVYCDHGTWAVRLVESKAEEGKAQRRLKTANAARVVPLHPEILRMGFLRHLETIAPGRDDPLFPDIKPQGLDGKRGPRITRWFVEYRRAVGVYRNNVGMHAFRHTAITRLTDAIVDEQQRRHRDFMMGHANGGSEGSKRYDKGPGLKAAADTMALLRYPDLDLAHLYMDASQSSAGRLHPSVASSGQPAPRSRKVSTAVVDDGKAG